MLSKGTSPIRERPRPYDPPRTLDNTHISKDAFHNAGEVLHGHERLWGWFFAAVPVGGSAFCNLMKGISFDVLVYIKESLFVFRGCRKSAADEYESSGRRGRVDGVFQGLQIGGKGVSSERGFGGGPYMFRQSLSLCYGFQFGRGDKVSVE